MIERRRCEREMYMRMMLTMGALCLLVGTADAQEVALRFQIVTNANDTLLLDTATGNVWHLTQYPDFNKDPLA